MTRSDSAPELGARLRAGEEAVLEVILRTHGPPVLTLLRQKFVGRLTAMDFEDVLAAALFRIVLKHGWQKARQLELSTEPMWLAEVIDWRQSDVETNGDSNHGADREHLPTLRVPPEQLRELLALLPEKQRRIVLADAESRDGLVASHDLAKELGIPQSTVRVYRRRALERLRREIELLDVAAGG